MRAVGTLVLAFALAVPLQGQAQAIVSGPINIDVVYANQGNLHFYSLTAPNYQAAFSLHYYEYLKQPQPDEARTQFLAFNLPGSVGRQLTAAFVGLQLSWNPRDYQWLDLPEHFVAVAEKDEPCGLVAFGEQQVLACPVSPWASAKQSSQANNLAWFIQLMEATRYRFGDRQGLVSREESRDALLHLLKRIPGGHEVDVLERGTAVGHQIPIGSMLRSLAAEALVHGGLLDAPMARPEPEIRRAAVEWNSERLPEEEAHRALVQALRDADSRVRAAAATALATEVMPGDRTTIEAIRGVIERESDPFVRQVIQELLDGATVQSEGNDRR